MTESALAGVAGVILAGGLSRRMGGGDKSLLKLGDRTVLSHVVARAKPQAHALVLNANGDPARFAEYGLPVIADVVPDFAGPLAGILTGMSWAKQHAPNCQWLVSFASDTPFFPADLAVKLLQAAQDNNTPLACARSGDRNHPVFGLWSMALFEQLRTAVESEGMRKIEAWTARYGCSEVSFPIHPFDPFFNINRPEDLSRAEQMLPLL